MLNLVNACVFRVTHAEKCMNPTGWFVILELTICKRLSHFCLLFDFRPTRENRLKISRRHFCTQETRNALKTQMVRNLLIYRHHFLPPNYKFQCSNRIIDNYTLQKRHFWPDFSQNSAWKVSPSPQAENQSPHAEMANAARDVCNFRVWSCPSPQAEFSLKPCAVWPFCVRRTYFLCFLFQNLAL